MWLGLVKCEICKWSTRTRSSQLPTVSSPGSSLPIPRLFPSRALGFPPQTTRVNALYNTIGPTIQSSQATRPMEKKRNKRTVHTDKRAQHTQTNTQATQIGASPWSTQKPLLLLLFEAALLPRRCRPNLCFRWFYQNTSTRGTRSGNTWPNYWLLTNFATPFTRYRSTNYHC